MVSPQWDRPQYGEDPRGRRRRRIRRLPQLRRRPSGLHRPRSGEHRPQFHRRRRTWVHREPASGASGHSGRHPGNPVTPAAAGSGCGHRLAPAEHPMSTPAPIAPGGLVLCPRAAATAVTLAARKHRPAATLLTYLVAVALTACNATSVPSSPHAPSTSNSRTGADRPVAADTSTTAATAPKPTTSTTAAGVYAHAAAGMLAPLSRKARALVYVPNSLDNTVSVIDQSTFRVIKTFTVGALPQHVVPAWDLSRLWVNDNNGNTLIPINPRNGARGKPVSVADPYNLYFSPTGSQAIVMAERLRRIDFRDPATMRLRRSLHVPCHGVNHGDFTADLRTFVVSCEFSGKLLVIPSSGTKIRKVVALNRIRTPHATDAMSAMR